jgi:hypothetical protein
LSKHFHVAVDAAVERLRGGVADLRRIKAITSDFRKSTRPGVTRTTVKKPASFILALKVRTDMRSRFAVSCFVSRSQLASSSFLGGPCLAMRQNDATEGSGANTV